MDDQVFIHLTPPGWLLAMGTAQALSYGPCGRIRHLSGAEGRRGRSREVSLSEPPAAGAENPHE